MRAMARAGETAGLWLVKGSVLAIMLDMRLAGEPVFLSVRRGCWLGILPSRTMRHAGSIARG